jgi:hypothetical protein
MLELETSPKICSHSVNKKVWRDGEYQTLSFKKKFLKCLFFPFVPQY